MKALNNQRLGYSTSKSPHITPRERATRLAAFIIGNMVAASTQAEFINDITIVPQLSMQIKNLKFDQSIQGGLLANVEDGSLSVNLPTINVALTTLYKSAYASLKYEISLGDNIAESSVPFAKPSSQVDRSDFSLTFGYMIWKKLLIFGGYLSGKTTLKPSESVIANENLIRSGCNLNAASCSTQVALNAAMTHKLLGIEQYEQEYKENGPFIGASYSFPIAGAGNISLSLAYAYMNGSYKDNYGVPFNGQPANFRFEGKSKGFSLGATWSSTLNDSLGYYFDLKHQLYSMDGDDKTGNLQFNGSNSRVKTDEKMTTLTIGIQAYF